jgi:pimeloyl-ACP methyl ester carboxylesterase
VDTLAVDRDVIAVDLPGHGDSPRQPKGTGSARTTWPSPSPSCSTNSACQPCTSRAAAGVRLTAKITRRVAPKAPRTRLGRGLSLMQASGHPFGLPYEPVRTAIHDMATAPGFRETLHALEKRQFKDGAAITVPVTVAFGSRDRVLLPKVARRRDQLPDQTRWVTLSECGHIPMFDDPEATADLLLAASDPAAAGTLGEPVR